MFVYLFDELFASVAFRIHLEYLQIHPLLLTPRHTLPHQLPPNSTNKLSNSSTNQVRASTNTSKCYNYNSNRSKTVTHLQMLLVCFFPKRVFVLTIQSNQSIGDQWRIKYSFNRSSICNSALCMFIVRLSASSFLLLSSA